MVFSDIARRKNIIQWAKDLWERKDQVVCLDTETTDTITPTSQIVQIGVVAQGDLRPLVLLNSLIRPLPDLPIAPKALQVNNLSEKDLAQGVDFKLVYPVLEEALAGKIIVAYNVGFDQVQLNNMCRLHGLPVFKNQWECAMLSYARYYGESGRYGDYKWQKLVNACRQMGIAWDEDEAHDATYDALQTMRLVQKLAESV